LNNNFKLYLTTIVAFWVLLISLGQTVYGQKNLEYGTPLITNFTVKDYRQGAQNFALAQNTHGQIFVGNSNGVMVYEGNFWKTYKVNNLSEVHSLFADTLTNRVYVGAQGEIGYLKLDEGKRKYAYQSLLNVLDKNTPDFHDVYQINRICNTLYFHTNTALIVYNKGQFRFVKLEVNNSRLFFVNGKILIYQAGEGVQQLNLSTLNLTPTNWNKENGQVLGIIPHFKGELWLTKEQGFYLRSEKEFKPWSSPVDSLLHNKTSFLYSLPNQKIAVGTLRNGLIILNSDGSLNCWINEQDGLVSNTVWAVLADQGRNIIWTAQNNGISKLDIGLPYRVFNSKGVIDNQFFTLQEFNNYVYAAGSSGLWRLPLQNDSNTQQFELVEELKDRAWFLAPYNYDSTSELLISSNAGLHSINENNSLQTILEDVRCWYILPLRSYPGYVFLNSATGFKLLSKKSGKWKVYKNLPTPKNSFYYFAEDREGNIWANSPTSGLFKFSFPSGINGKLAYELYNDTQGLPSHLNNVPFLVGDSLIVGTIKGAHYYQKPTNSFKPHSLLNTQILPGLDCRLSWLEEDDSSRLYYVYGQEKENGYYHKAGYARRDDSGKFKVSTKAFQPIEDSKINDFLVVDENSVFLATSSGIFFTKPEVKQQNGPKIYLSSLKVFNPDSLINFNGTTLRKPDHEDLTFSLPYENNTFSVNVGTYRPKKQHSIQYQYWVAGLEENWGPWTVSSVREFSQLREGTYTLYVRAQDQNYQPGEVLAIPFEILTPWYRSGWALLLYGLGILCIIWLFGFVYNLRLKNRTLWLEKVVGERTSEISRRNQEIEEKNKLLQEKSRKIELQSSAILNKNQALEAAKYTIAQQLDELKNVNSVLETKVTQRTAELQRAYKELLLLKEELDTFIYKSSHDINGPLMRLRGLCQVAQLEVKNENEKSYLNLLCGETDRAIFILKKLLVFYDVKNKEPIMNWLPCHMLVEDLERQLSQRNLLEYANISWFIHPEVNYIITDKSLLQIILYQMLENAISYRQSKIANIEVNLQAQGAGQIRIDVLDDGIGIPAAAQDKVFKMFYRATVKSAGPGMGLYTARTAVMKLGGTIELSATSARTHFIIILPTRHSEQRPHIAVEHISS
jgi:signal transduction histidine kinase/ligand-binding sensor domain-containing protein